MAHKKTVIFNLTASETSNKPLIIMQDGKIVGSASSMLGKSDYYTIKKYMDRREIETLELILNGKPAKATYV